eukprot:scaffold13215_cov61-Cyclotella_meneghiniana.AAC.5
MSAHGNPGCQCKNETDALASLSERSCTLDDGSPGVILQLREDACFSTSYGSSACVMHDMIHDPLCNASVDVMPSYCVQPWCYVDLESCTKDSDEIVYRSSYFGVDSGVDVYFSYSTCNATVDGSDLAQVKKARKGFMGGVDIRANVPTYRFPYIYKRDEGGEGLASIDGPEYYDNSIPWAGAYIDLVNGITELAGEDISSFNYTYKSRASGIANPASSFTAACQDIQSGLADMSVDERLSLSAFTLPIVYDKAYLVIPKPGSSNSLAKQTQKVLQPFTPQLWILVLVVIFVAAILGCWFAGDAEEVSTRIESDGTKPSRLFRAQMYTRIGVDSFLEKDLELEWPDAKFYYNLDDKGFFGMLDDYTAGKCDVLAVGYEDTILSAEFLEKMCENNLVYTSSVVVEVPIAFPIRQDLSSGFSYWVREAKRNGIDLEAAKEKYQPSASCEIQLEDVEMGGDEYAQITVPNMVFVFCALLGIALQVEEKYNVKKGKASVLGRKSSLGKSMRMSTADGKSDFRENDSEEDNPIVSSLEAQDE